MDADHLYVLWTNADPVTSDKMVFMYTRNAMLNHWFKEVTLIVWGATQKLVAEDEGVQFRIREMQQAGVHVSACIGCSNQLGLTDKLRELGIEVCGWGGDAQRGPEVRGRAALRLRNISKPTGDANMKIMQSWDDGVVDDARLVEVLRRHGATSTFNLNIRLNESGRVFGWKFRDKDVWRLGLGEMPDLYDGFEIASHSLTHPHLTRIPRDEMVEEVAGSRAELQEMFGQPVEGFCYPFGDFDDEVVRALKDAGYTHARGVGHGAEGFPTWPPADPFAFRPHCHFLNEDFWGLFERARAAEVPYFFFWGHSYEILDEPMWADIEDKVRRLSEHPDTEWVNISDMFRD